MATFAAHEHADALQPAQGFQEHRATADRQVAALHQADRQFTRQQHVFEPQRIGMAARQQGHAGAVRLAPEPATPRR